LLGIRQANRSHQPTRFLVLDSSFCGAAFSYDSSGPRTRRWGRNFLFSHRVDVELINFPWIISWLNTFLEQLGCNWGVLWLLQVCNGAHDSTLTYY
jgi:hypothetical protein